MPASAVLGCGRHLPARVVTGEDLAPDLGVPASEIVARSGVVRRHYAEPGVGPSDLGCEAARAALAMAGRQPAEVDLIVFATMTPDLTFPGSGCLLQDKLGCRTVGALDIRAQDAGFLFGLATADHFVRAGVARYVLVVAGEVHSTALDFRPAGATATPYFGDGAGAVLLGPATTPGVLAVVLHGDPTGFERYWCEFPASRHYPARMDREAFEAGRHFYRLDPPALHPEAETALARVAREALARADVPAGRVALWIVHYLDHRIARRAAEALDVPPERVVVPAEVFGHVASAGIPIALAEALASGRLGRGELVGCAAFGAGMSWAAAVLRL